MKLALTFTDTNLYPNGGIFIKHASPKVWLTEMKRMQLKLSDCTLYPCPGLEANSVSGVLLLFTTAQKKLDIGANVSIQKVHANFYIPENTQLNMALTNEEYDTLVNGKPHFFHHTFGMMELTEEFSWETILNPPIEQFPVIGTPAKGVKIPTEVKAFSIEIEEVEEEDALKNPFGDQPIDSQDVPFNMKKVLKGNNVEIEKYLKYLAQNPEAALKMAIPLDMMGTSRGKAYAKYKFKSNFFESLGFEELSEQTKSGIKTILGILAIIFIFWIGYTVIHEVKLNKVEVVAGETTFSSDSKKKPPQEDVVIESTETNSDEQWSSSTTTTPTPKPAEETSMIPILLTILFILGTLVLLLYFFKNKKARHTSQNDPKNKSTSWLDLPEDSEHFSFDEDDAQKQSGFYFGGNELSIKNKIIIICILIGLLTYLFYPMLQTNEIGTVFALLAAFIVLRLLYLLLNKNKTIIDDNE